MGSNAGFWFASPIVDGTAMLARVSGALLSRGRPGNTSNVAELPMQLSVNHWHIVADWIRIPQKSTLTNLSVTNSVQCGSWCQLAPRYRREKHGAPILLRSFFGSLTASLHPRAFCISVRQIDCV